MKRIAARDVEVTGNLNRRIRLNQQRLQSQTYSLEQVFQSREYAWPGDFEGRTLLALVSLWKATGTEDARIAQIVDRLPKTRGKRYLGEPLDVRLTDEQQVAGNGWLLRGLCEYALCSGREDVREILRDIAENFLLPLKAPFRNYPVTGRETNSEGEAIGEIFRVENGWKLSTDVGCAFIVLDAVVQTYEILQDERLRALIEEILEKFLQTDVLQRRCQTHATLSAVRGMLRYYGVCGEKRYLQRAEALAELYFRYGMTLNGANYNWFLRPTWTEPCAIVDSIMVCSGLFEYTGNLKYLRMLQKICYNAMRFAQRDNGGFGCDACVTEEQAFLKVMPQVFEAFWCCTMRGSEGLLCMKESQYFAEGREIVVGLPTCNKLTLDGGKTVIEQETEYPFAGKMRFVTHAQQPFRLRIPLPEGVGKVCVSGCDAEILPEEILLKDLRDAEAEISFEIGIRNRQAGSGKVYFLGNLLLGECPEAERDLAERLYEQDGRILCPVYDMSRIGRERAEKIAQRIVFARTD